MFRLFIDIAIPGTEVEALKAAQEILNYCFDNHISIEKLQNMNIDTINFRLGHDQDRQKSNYFMKNDNGHVNNKKSRIVVKTSQDTLDSEEN
jgi:hypothetical protein